MWIMEIMERNKVAAGDHDDDKCVSVAHSRSRKIIFIAGVI